MVKRDVTLTDRLQAAHVGPASVLQGANWVVIFTIRRHGYTTDRRESLSETDATKLFTEICSCIDLLLVSSFDS